MMYSAHRPTISLLLAAVLCAISLASQALISISEGNEPIGEHIALPTGAAEVANLPSRLGYKEGPPFGGGEYFFEYHCTDTQEFNGALEKFGAIRTPRVARQSLISVSSQKTHLLDIEPLLLVVHDANRDGDSPEAFVTFEKRTDWTFTVWNPESYYRHFFNPQAVLSDHPNFRQPFPPPRIDVYLGGDCPIDWDKVKVPSNVRVIDKRVKAAPGDLEDGGLICGRLYDMATHQLIEDARVILVKHDEGRTWEKVAETKTGQDGLFKIAVVPRGYYRIRVSAAGYAGRETGSFSNRSGHEHLEFDAVLSAMTTLKGRVVGDDGRGIPNVVVQPGDVIGIDGFGYECSDKPSATTDEKGHFELTALPRGFATIRCRAESLHQQGDIFERYSTFHYPWEESQVIQIVVTGTGVVTGRVMDTEGEPPYREFIAAIEPKGGNKPGSWGGSMKCKADGAFEFTGVPPGYYVVTVYPNPHSQGEACEPQTAVVKVGDTVKLEFVTEHAHKEVR